MLLRTLGATLLGALAVAAPASAADPLAGLNDCPAYGDLRICSGQVPSFDGSPLDVDLTFPSRDTGGRHPLMIFLHGFGNNKREWESIDDEGDGADKHRWNSHWFARHGFYVLTYTARGFQTDFPTDERPSYQPDTPGGTSVDPPSGTIHIKSREFEVRDTQYLAALVADAFPDLDRDRVAVSGGSYGGGESWLQAADPTWDSFPDLPELRLQVAVPKYPWTDVGYALAPNGHGGGPNGDDIYESSLGRPESEEGQGYPIGTAKASYITGLFARGASRGVFKSGPTATPNEEDGRSPAPVSIPAWNTRIVGGGDPYSPEDPIIQQARRGLTDFRSAYYQDWTGEASERKVAVYSIQGWTDDLFEAVESFRMFKFLKRMDPRWPVEVSVADVGHSRAQNKPATWKRLNAQAWQFLKSNLNGAHERETTVSSEPTLCSVPNGDASMRLTGRTPEDLASGTLSVAFQEGDEQTNLSGADDTLRDGAATDPIVGSIVAPTPDECRRSTRARQRDTTGYTAISDPLPKSRTYIGLGFVEVPDYFLAGATATLNARVWDILPDGTPETLDDNETLLMTRGTYRLDTLAGENDPDPASGTLRLPLYGNHWPLAPGHRLRVDLQEIDAPTFRPTNAPNTLSFGPPTLVLPTRQAGNLTLTGE